MTKKLRQFPPRLVVEITDEQEQAMRDLLPHGTKKIVFRLFIDDLIDALRKDERILGAFIARELRARDLLKEVDL